MSILKTVTYGITGGLTIGGVWNLQEANPLLGTVVGLAVLLGWIVITSKKVSR